MSRTLILGTLFASLLMNSALAQNKDEPPTGGPPYPGGSEITFQWNYSCPSGQNCSFTCAAPGGASGALGASGAGAASGTDGMGGMGGMSGMSGAGGASGASGLGGATGASHTTKLAIYLGSIPVGGNQKAPALLYEFSTREIPRGNGFIISAGISTLSCQINGFALDYSGPPHDTTAGINQKNK